jgi:hypothetical protein
MTTNDGWDDARLSAVFAAMATKVEVPADLATSTMAAVRATATGVGRRRSRWAALLPAAAAVGTVAASVVVAVALIGGLSPDGPVGSVGPVEPAGSATPQATTPRGDPAPAKVADLPRLSVEDLLARIEAGPTADEVIVHGWLGRSSAIVDCELVAEPHALMPHCEEFGLFLMQDEADPDGDGTLRGPAVPFLIPMLRFDAQVGANPLPGQAIEVLAVGHLLDHRWTSCPPAAAEECRERFVIDRVVPADSEIAEISEPWLHDADPDAAAIGVVPVIESAVGEIEVVSIGALPTDSIRLIDRGADLLIEQDGTELVWVVRALTAGPTRAVATTYLVPAAPLRNGDALVYRITVEGADEMSVAVAPAPTRVYDIDVLSVEAAIEIRDAGADDREIAIRGWFSPPPDTFCPLMLATSPVQPDCRDQMTFLVAAPEPGGPRIHIDLDDLVSGWWPKVPGNGPSTPVEIVVIGHFDDRRSTFCPPYVEPECRDRFVVDRVDWVHGESMPLSVENPFDGQTTSTPEQVEAMVASVAPASPILSIVVVDGPIGLVQIEPELRDDVTGLTTHPVIWVVRVLESEHITTYLVIDGSDEFQVLVSTPSPSLVAGGEHPATFSFPLTGVPDRPVPFEVLDRLEALEDAREATPAEMARPWPATNGLRIENLAAETVLVRWTGSGCDRRPRLTIAPDPSPGGRHHGLHLSDARPACDAMGIGRGIVLHLKISFDADDFVGTEEIELVAP